MAISANAVWEVRTAGNDTNGGGFITGATGVDYSQQNAKNTVGNNISTTDVVANGTTTLTSATASFTADIVGNIIYLQGGTGTLAITRKQVATFVNSTTITVDAGVIAAGIGITMNIGGALASIGEMGRNWIGGNTGWILAGSYTITLTTINVSGGVFSKSNISGSVIGYQTSRGDFGTRPVITASGISTFTMITLGTSTGNNFIGNIELDGASLTSSKGFNATGRTTIYRCIARNCTNNGFLGTGDSAFINCYATGCSTATAMTGSAYYVNCLAKSNTITGITVSTGTAINCISANNSGATSDGFLISGGSTRIQNCTAYLNGRDGFRFNGDTQIGINCIAEANVGIGFNGLTNASLLWLNNAAFNNGTDFVPGTGKAVFNLDSIIGSGTFFTNATAGDFSLNNTAGAGAAARATGTPGVFPDGLTTSFLDRGAAQHQDSGGGGSSEHSAVF